MKRKFPDSEILLPVAITVSAALHAAVIMGATFSPSSPGASVFEGPSSPEIDVIYQPVVSVLEAEIKTEPILENSDQVIMIGNTDDKPEKEPVQSDMASLEIRGAVTEAKPLMQANLAPEYPKIARQKGWEGTVKLSALIEKDGTPHQIGVLESSGYEILDQAAAKAVQNWQFIPARSGTLNLTSTVSIPIRFNLLKNP